MPRRYRGCLAGAGTDRRRDPDRRQSVPRRRWAAVFNAQFATPDGYAATVAGLFEDMFTAKMRRATHGGVRLSSASQTVVAARSVGKKMLLDAVLRYDVGRLPAALAGLRVHGSWFCKTTFSTDVNASGAACVRARLRPTSTWFVHSVHVGSGWRSSPIPVISRSA